jgi:hypothetical protein
MQVLTETMARELARRITSIEVHRLVPEKYFRNSQPVRIGSCSLSDVGDLL